MKIRASFLSALIFSVFLLGCESTGIDERTAGQVIGGVAGAAAGSQVGDGTGQTIATVAGALIGSMVGERIGARMQERDLNRTAEALNETSIGETTRWENPETDNVFAVTPEDEFVRDGYECREFDFRVETPQGSETETKTACRQPDGSWRIIS